MSIIVLPKLIATRVFFGCFKGGVGKTVGSLIVHSETENCLTITNDAWAGHAQSFNKEGTKVLRLNPSDPIPELPITQPLVFDAGGYGDVRMTAAATDADVVIVPTTPDINSIKGMITTIEQLRTVNDNIIIVVNKAKKGDMQNVRMALSSMTSRPYLSQYPMVELMESKMFNYLAAQGVSISEQYNKSGLSRHWYKKPMQQVETLFETINNMVLENSVAA